MKRFILKKFVTVQPVPLLVIPAFSGDQKGADEMPESHTRFVPRERIIPPFQVLLGKEGNANLSLEIADATE
ncbi:MAG: hypothetical protein Q9P14_04370 [candidate division KSB1 bacterium]|nr:hypothetical protein [candidate division KSB1 bacterium]MDQ7064247.1 hypothetical protein [candidate division KSB1 bacterium]